MKKIVSQAPLSHDESDCQCRCVGLSALTEGVERISRMNGKDVVIEINSLKVPVILGSLMAQMS